MIPSRSNKVRASKGFVRSITGGAAEQAGKQAAEEAAQQTGKEGAQQVGKQAAEEAAQQAGKAAAQHTAKELVEDTVEPAAKATTPVGVHTPKRTGLNPDGVHVHATSKPLTEGQQTTIRKIDNTIRGHLKPGPRGDISGTISDMVGNPISKPGGGYWDHVQEMQNTLRGLRKHAATLKGIADPAAQASRQRALDAIAEVETAIKGAGL